MRFEEYTQNTKTEEVLWFDKKRYFGIPLSFTSYKIYPTRLTVEKGFIRMSYDNTLLYRVLDIEINQGFFKDCLESEM